MLLLACCPWRKKIGNGNNTSILHQLSIYRHWKRQHQKIYSYFVFIPFLFTICIGLSFSFVIPHCSLFVPTTSKVISHLNRLQRHSHVFKSLSTFQYFFFTVIYLMKFTFLPCLFNLNWKSWEMHLILWTFIIFVGQHPGLPWTFTAYNVWSL